jgi:hypothetical protein
MLALTTGYDISFLLGRSVIEYNFVSMQWNECRELNDRTE